LCRLYFVLSVLGVSATKEIKQVVTENNKTVENNKNSFKIFPNYVRDNFILEVNNSYTGKMNVQIIDQSGKIIHQFSFNKEQHVSRLNLSASDLSAGLYYIKVQIAGWSDTRKLLKL
jgi:hypothetical protein